MDIEALLKRHPADWRIKGDYICDANGNLIMGASPSNNVWLFWAINAYAALKAEVDSLREDAIGLVVESLTDRKLQEIWAQHRFIEAGDGDYQKIRDLIRDAARAKVKP